MLEIDKYQSPEIGELAGALSAAQGEITFALKDCSTTAFSNGKTARKYASLQSVLSAIKEPLAKHGLSFIQSTLPYDNGIAIRTVLMHKSGQWVSGVFILPADRQGGIQGLGSSLTYARRYALSALIGICADDDDDGEGSKNACSKSEPAPAPAPRKSSPEDAEKKRIGEYLWQVAIPAVYPDTPTSEYSNIVFELAKGGMGEGAEQPARLYGYDLIILRSVENHFKNLLSKQKR